MTRVLNIISDSNIGGAGRVLLSYLRFADKSRFQTLAALPRGSLLSPALMEAGAEVYEVDGIADRSYHQDDVRVLKALLARMRPDLVHTHGCLSGRVAAKRLRIPVVYSRHSAFPVPAKLRYPPGRWVNKWVNEHYADHIIAVSPAARDNLTDSGISPAKITVVLNGTAPVERTPPEARAALKQELGLPPDVPVFGILARIEDYKGHLDLVEAARLLKKQGRDRFRVLVAGSGTFEAEVSRAVTASGVGDVVRLLGFRRDVAALLNILDVQLNASYGTEATSMALLEGMSLGLPTIASDYGGNPFLISDGDNGLIFPARDSRALADAMLQLMDHPEQRQAMGLRAKEVFQSRFTGEIFAQNVERVYDGVLKGASHGTK